MSVSRIVVILVIVFSLSFGMHAYFWLRLVRSPGLQPPWSRLATVVLLGMAAYLPLSMWWQRASHGATARGLVWLTYVWMGLAFLLLVVLLAGEVVRVMLFLWERLWAGAHPPARHDRTLALASLAAAVALGGIAMVFALRRPPVREVTVPIARWPEALSGYRIVQISDIHAGLTVGRGFVERAVARANALEPDLVAVTGDLADGSVPELGEVLAPLGQLRGRDGVYFVTGNHEYYSGADAWVDYVRSLGIRVLHNERVSIGGPGGFDLAGVDDASAHHFGPGHGADLPGALRGRDPQRPLVLLAHQPITAIEAEALGVDLQISGHTHGGQIFPIHGIVRLIQPVVAGLRRFGRMWIYVSRGTGYWGPPMRLGAPSEIARIELVPDGRP